MKRIFGLVLSLVLLMGLLSPGLAQTTEENTDTYFSVLFSSNNIPADFSDQVAGLGGEVVYAVPEIGFAQVKASSSDFTALKGLSSVQAANPSLNWEVPETEQIELEGEVNIEDAALWDLQWDIKRITQDGASYELGTGSHNTVVGIVDTGIDRDHSDLVGNLLPGSKNFVPAGGFRGNEPYENGDINAFDDLHGHGSHVAGSIAGNGAMLGVAPDMGVKAYRVFGRSSAESGWIYAAMIAAANDGVDVISMSLGGIDVLGQVFYTDPDTGETYKLGNDVADFIAYKRAVKYAEEKGSLVVVAAGNTALNATNKKEVTDYLNDRYGKYGYTFEGASFYVPASITGAVTVSATGPTDLLSVYSNYGAGFVNIAAPGGDIRYLYEFGRTKWIQEGWYKKELNLSASSTGGYYYSAGTSMATPKVSAVAALLIDKYGKMKPTDVANLLYKKAVDPVSGDDKDYFGAGHLNALNALK